MAENAHNPAAGEGSDPGVSVDPPNHPAGAQKQLGFGDPSAHPKAGLGSGGWSLMPPPPDAGVPITPAPRPAHAFGSEPRPALVPGVPGHEDRRHVSPATAASRRLLTDSSGGFFQGVKDVYGDNTLKAVVGATPVVGAVVGSVFTYQARRERNQGRLRALLGTVTEVGAGIGAGAGVRLGLDFVTAGAYRGTRWLAGAAGALTAVAMGAGTIFERNKNSREALGLMRRLGRLGAIALRGAGSAMAMFDAVSWLKGDYQQPGSYAESWKSFGHDHSSIEAYAGEVHDASARVEALQHAMATGDMSGLEAAGVHLPEGANPFANGQAEIAHANEVDQQLRESGQSSYDSNVLERMGIKGDFWGAVSELREQPNVDIYQGAGESWLAGIKITEPLHIAITADNDGTPHTTVYSFQPGEHLGVDSEGIRVAVIGLVMQGGEIVSADQAAAIVAQNVGLELPSSSPEASLPVGWEQMSMEDREAYLLSETMRSLDSAGQAALLADSEDRSLSEQGWLTVLDHVRDKYGEDIANRIAAEQLVYNLTTGGEQGDVEGTTAQQPTGTETYSTTGPDLSRLGLPGEMGPQIADQFSTAVNGLGDSMASTNPSQFAQEYLTGYIAQNSLNLPFTPEQQMGIMNALAHWMLQQQLVALEESSDENNV